jgi:putative cell wall-binding protein
MFLAIITSATVSLKKKKGTTMKKLLVVFFSLLLVFLMIPVLPTTAYADTEFDGAAYLKAFAANGGFELETAERAVKVPDSAPGLATRSTPKFTKPGTITLDEWQAEAFVDKASLPLTGWITVDNDGDGYSWMYGSDYSPVFTSLDGSDGDCAVSASYVNGWGALIPDNWLISPAVSVPAGKQLQFFVTAQDPSYAAENYEVLVSTKSQTDLDSFEPVYTETVKVGGKYEGRTVDLAAYAGKTVYFAFRHCDCTDMYWLLIDGIGLSAAGSDPTAPAPLDPRARLVRIKGRNRYETSIAIAKQFLFDYGAEGYPNVIISTGDNFADALAGAALSAEFAAPIILVSDKVPASLDAAMDFIDEWVDIDGGTAFILGGKGAVPESVEGMLDELGIAHERFAGKGRYETNLMVLKRLVAEEALSGGKALFFCDGTNWPDAATAAGTGIPMMLVAKTGLNEDQTDFMESFGEPMINVVIGGTGAVSAETAAQLEPYTHPDELAEFDGVWRIFGKDRAATAVALAENVFQEPEGVIFAYGANYPDTIAGGLLGAYMGLPILYGDSNAPKTYVEADGPYLEELGLSFAYILGGKGLVSYEFANDLLQPYVPET